MTSNASLDKDRIHQDSRNKSINICDQEAIHLLGAIQGGVGNVIYINWPSGEVIAVDKHINANMSWQNTKIGMNLQDIINESHMTSFCKHVERMMANRSKRTFFFLNDTAISLSTTASDFSILCLELEEIGDTDAEKTVYFDSLMYLGTILQYEDEEAITKAAVETLMNILEGYDRGMVYRFNADKSGQVLHEITTDDCLTSSYLGLRFPASDIPLPARRMYVLNGYRYIYDAEEHDVELITATRQASAIDMTQCRMRSVSKYHIMYLQNMGVRSSMSLPIVVDGELWGIIAFHGYKKPYRPTLHQRIACETLSTLASVRVEALVRKKQTQRALELSNMFIKWNVDESIIPNIYRLGQGLLQSLDADVMSVVVEGFDEESTDSVTIGDKLLSPGKDFWSAFDTFPSGQVLTVSTRKECEDLGLSLEDCPSNGFAYFREGKLHVMFGRAASSRDVVWAGNPDEAKLKDKSALHPRKSFASFMKKAAEEARLWTKTDLSILKIFSDRICRISHEHTLKCLRESVEDSNVRYVSAVNKARDNYEFFAHLSHELRTPFHGVMGCLNVLNDSVKELSEEGIRELINGALASGNHMLTLLNDILSLSKDKYLAHHINEDAVIYQSLVFEAVDSFRSLAAKQGLKLSCDVPEEEKVWITTDRTKVTQIIANLINNALKFARKDTTVSTEFRLVEDCIMASNWCVNKTSNHSASVFCLEQDAMISHPDEFINSMNKLTTKKREWLCFSVEDWGCGMESEDLQRMFEPYTQASQGSSRTVAGTGLGLFICVSLCERMGGFISCASTAEKGTLFCVAVPVKSRRKSISNSDGLSSSGSYEEETKASTEHPSDILMTGPILIVDDSPMNLKLLSRQLNIALKREGWDNIEIVHASGGREAVLVFKETKPSVVIMDYHMPEMDGSLAIKLIRDLEKSEEEYGRSHVIAYTADGTDGAAKILFDRGADELLEKPPPKDFATHLLSRFVSGDLTSKE